METTDDATKSTAQAATATTTEWSPELATVLTGAAELARTAIIEHSGDDTVGDYLGVGYEDPASATHRFLAHLPGYQGWQWAVVVASYPGADHATVSEVVLVPGPESLLAPQWVPWDERVQPGDLSPGDLLAPLADDLRLVPGYMSSGSPQVDGVAGELPGVVSHLERVAGLVGREIRDEDKRFAFALDLVVDLDVVGLHVARVGIVGCEGVEVGDEEVAVVILLEVNPVVEGSHVVAEVQAAGGTHAAQHAFAFLPGVLCGERHLAGPSGA